ncbi:MAG: translation initiation factor IF-2 [Saprospiraceae bacterium]
MDKRLVLVAKELNVGTSTIVDHLSKNGFEIDNKPTAKVTDVMYDVLLKEFQGSASIKVAADQMIIGTRPIIKKEEVKVEVPAERKVIFGSPKKEDPPAPAVVEAPVVEKPVEKAPVKEAEPQAEVADDGKPKLTVIGKIDLDKPKAKKITKTEAPEAKAEPAKVETAKPKTEEVVKAPAITPVVDPIVVAEESTEEVMHRAETPQLKGLKILGKIDTGKFDRPKKKPDAAPAAGTNPAAPGSAESEAEKKKRKRKKITGQRPMQDNNPGANRPAGGPPRKGPVPEAPKEVSQKQIDEKIKATMARLNFGGKNKRGKVRRDVREEKRQKQEALHGNGESDILQVAEFISVSELASVMNVSVTQVITTCMQAGYMVSINQRLDAELIELLTEEFGFTVKFISAEEQIEEADIEVDDEADMRPRAPIVTVMGHVDHGKTSLLDFVRSANIASGEAGGITQHIGAYEVEIGEEKKKITFLDTPGHEAFTAMRARGAKVTDVVVVIVAADDNIMPQTKEAISHAQAAGVPIIFAINKIDKAGADPERIKGELAQLNFLVEDWGGKYQSQDISAKNGTGIPELLEKIILEADILDLQANPVRKAAGTVIEASLDKGRGYVTKMLVQNGTLHIGDPMVAGEYSGKVKAMFNEHGKKIKTAGPSTPVLVLGLTGAPQAGEKFKIMANEVDARQVANKRSQISREQANRSNKRISLDEIGRRLALGTFKELNLIVKGDVDGSVEALSDSLIKLSIEKVQVNVIHKAVGQIIESDVLLASASDAIIIGFQVRPSLGARKLAEREGVEIKLYSIIYEAIEELKLAIEGMLEPTKEEVILGQVRIREVYKISKVGTVAGCYVEEGKIQRNANIRVIRDGIVVYPTKEGMMGELTSLKRFKDDAKEVKAGLECGLTIRNFNDIKEDDVIEAYEITEVKTKLTY